MVAPHEVVAEFIRMSNIATTRPMFEEEMTRLRLSFGLQREDTEFDRHCNHVTRRWVLVIGAGIFGLFATYVAFLVLSVKAYCGFLVVLCCGGGIYNIYYRFSSEDGVSMTIESYLFL